MDTPNEDLRELSLLEQIESDPNVNQSALATRLAGSSDVASVSRLQASASVLPSRK
jgi:hypothetical protein